MSYRDWNYSTKGYIPQELNKNIKELIKTNNSDYVKEFFYWLSDNHKDFSFMYRDNLISHLLQHQHFDLAEELFTKQIFKFDEKIALQCAFTLGLQFEENFFNYWREKVQKFDLHSQSSCYKKFWHEFFSYQFLRSEEVMDNLPNLVYVFDKVPFYIESEYDIVNGYLIKSREDFLKNRLSSLDKKLQPVILQKISVLCGLYYSQFQSTFEEEFQKFPDMVEIFQKAHFYQKLNDKFEQKPYNKKNKI